MANLHDNLKTNMVAIVNKAYSLSFVKNWGSVDQIKIKHNAVSFSQVYYQHQFYSCAF